MLFIKSKVPGVLAIIIFISTSLIEEALEKTDSTHDIIFFAVAMPLGLISSVLCVYVFNITFYKQGIDDEEGDGEQYKHLDKPVFGIVLAALSFVTMIYFMVGN